MNIESISAIPGYSGFFFDDQRAIKQGRPENGFTYSGEPLTDGYEAIRQAGEALIISLELSDGSSVRGDCAAVQYSGVGGRDPLFKAQEYAPIVEGIVAESLVGRDAAMFGENVAEVESLTTNGSQLHTAIRYGASQALLKAASRACGVTQTEVLAQELRSEPAREPVPVFGQSGDDRYVGAEKMLLKRVPVLPHGLFNSISKMGKSGEGLVDYINWLAERSTELAPSDYQPRFHIDVYGLIGEIFGPPFDGDKIIDYFATLEEAANGYSLQIEGPMDANNRRSQINAMCELREALAEACIDVDIVADEWCNTLEDVRAFVDAEAADMVQIKTPDIGGVHQSGEAVLYCEGTNVSGYIGGTCNETAISSQACAHVALATDAAQILAKPGMGFDEGYMIVENEMRLTCEQLSKSKPR